MFFGNEFDKKICFYLEINVLKSSFILDIFRYFRESETDGEHKVDKWRDKDTANSRKVLSLWGMFR